MFGNPVNQMHAQCYHNSNAGPLLNGRETGGRERFLCLFLKISHSLKQSNLAYSLSTYSVIGWDGTIASPSVLKALSLETSAMALKAASDRWGVSKRERAQREEHCAIRPCWGRPDLSCVLLSTGLGQLLLSGIYCSLSSTAIGVLLRSEAW